MRKQRKHKDSRRHSEMVHRKDSDSSTASGKISDFKDAYLEEITSEFMKINYDGKHAIINFRNKISEDEIRSTLISMIKEIE